MDGEGGGKIGGGEGKGREGVRYPDGCGKLAEVAEVHGAAAVEGYEGELFGGSEEVGCGIVA